MQRKWARCLPQRAASSVLYPADNKQVRTGAMELGKVLTPQSRLLHVVPSKQEADETGAVELRKVLTPESRLLHVVPGGQEAVENSL